MYKYVMTWLKVLGLSFTLTLSGIAMEAGSGIGKWIFIGTGLLIAFIILKIVVKLISGLKYVLQLRMVKIYLGEEKTLIAFASKAI